MFQLARNVPAVQQKIKKERESVKAMIVKKLAVEGPTNYTIPEKGWTKEQILKMMTEYQKKEEEHYKDGKVSGDLLKLSHETRRPLHSKQRSYEVDQ